MESRRLRPVVRSRRRFLHGRATSVLILAILGQNQYRGSATMSLTPHTIPSSYDTPNTSVFPQRLIPRRPAACP
ncbi:MAG: hypothetical protein GY820_01085 [Gammaproteobacteria bacterium]|nr:hypothetical protein [Gammaproteobacteria bacterium]